MCNVIKTSSYGSILDFTFQTPLQCKIALKTGMQTVCDVKSRIDPCLSDNSHGSKLLLVLPSLHSLHGTEKVKFWEQWWHVCFGWGDLQKEQKYFTCTLSLAVNTFLALQIIVTPLFKLTGFKFFSVLKNSID